MPTQSLPTDISPLLHDLSSPTHQFLTQFIYAQTDAQRTAQLAIMRRNDLYYNGKQYLVLTSTGDYKPLASGGGLGVVNNSNNAVLGQIYDYVLNVLKGDILKFVAVLGARAPNVSALARDPKDERHNSRRMTADRTAQYLRTHWKLDDIQPLICMILAKYGTAFSYVRYTSDARRFGTTQMPRMGFVDASGPGVYQCFNCGAESPENAALALGGPGPQCPRCGVPLGPESLVPAEPLPSIQAQTTESYPNGSVDLDIATAATVNAPWWEPTIERVPWLLYQFKEDRGRLAQAIPEYAEKLRNGATTPWSPSTPTESYTQDQLKSPTGYPYYTMMPNSSQALYSRLFVQPFAYEYYPGDQSGDIRERLYNEFPDGAMLTLVNNDLVRIEPRRLAAHWAVCKATPTESLFSPAYFEEYIQGQDVINDALNAIVEAMERSTPLTIVHPDVIDQDRLARYSATPGEFLFAKQGAGMDLQRMVYKLQAAAVDPALFNVIDQYINRLRENHGILPAIFGAADEATARQTDVNRNQALQVLATVHNAMRAFQEQKVMVCSPRQIVTTPSPKPEE